MQLLPCPCCKSTAVNFFQHSGCSQMVANCVNCGAQGPKGIDGGTEAATKEWNAWAVGRAWLVNAPQDWSVRYESHNETWPDWIGRI